ncbi:MAG: hypothetical protein JWP44_964, partial [Mucilaginibacter sp.]|nr:hypothetical protein [Mucilaginibacter sp.]
MRLTVLCFLFILFWRSECYAQPDSLSAKQNQSSVSTPTQPIDTILRDSITKAYQQELIADSVTNFYLQPDPSRKSQLVNEILKNDLSFIYSFSSPHKKQKTIFRGGQPREAREQWVIGAIIGLLMYIAFLNLFLGKDLLIVIQSFYNKHALSHLDKEGGIISSWAFIGLFILFSLAFGLVLYNLTVYYNVLYYSFTGYSITGFQLFISLSVVIGLLFAVKFLVLRFIGFVFNINSVIRQYIAILNLTYFNIAFVLLFIAICFSLMANRFIPVLLIFTLGAIAVIFGWQYLRNSVNIISNFRFHKFYLFIYLCALEI